MGGAMNAMGTMTNVGELMSNFDREIDREVETKLKENPNKTYADYPGYHFYAAVWFDGEDFQAEVWRNHAIVDTHQAPTPGDLMESISSEHGYE